MITRSNGQERRAVSTSEPVEATTTRKSSFSSMRRTSCRLTALSSATRMWSGGVRCVATAERASATGESGGCLSEETIVFRPIGDEAFQFFHGMRSPPADDDGVRGNFILFIAVEPAFADF